MWLKCPQSAFSPSLDFSIVVFNFSAFFQSLTKNSMNSTLTVCTPPWPGIFTGNASTHVSRSSVICSWSFEFRMVSISRVELCGIYVHFIIWAQASQHLGAQTNLTYAWTLYLHMPLHVSKSVSTLCLLHHVDVRIAKLMHKSLKNDVWMLRHVWHCPVTMSLNVHNWKLVSGHPITRVYEAKVHVKWAYAYVHRTHTSYIVPRSEGQLETPKFLPPGFRTYVVLHTSAFAYFHNSLHACSVCYLPYLTCIKGGRYPLRNEDEVWIFAEILLFPFNFSFLPKTKSGVCLVNCENAHILLEAFFALEIWKALF